MDGLLVISILARSGQPTFWSCLRIQQLAVRSRQQQRPRRRQPTSQWALSIKRPKSLVGMRPTTFCSVLFSSLRFSSVRFCSNPFCCVRAQSSQKEETRTTTTAESEGGEGHSIHIFARPGLAERASQPAAAAKQPQWRRRLVVGATTSRRRSRLLQRTRAAAAAAAAPDAAGRVQGLLALAG